MNKHVLLGIDSTLSPATQHALRTIGDLIDYATPMLHLILLHVIPQDYETSPTLAMYTGHLQTTQISAEQRAQAEAVLEKASAELKKTGIASERIDTLIRMGMPADEIVRVAKELHVDLIVVGSRGDTLSQKIRRFLLGSISRKVLRLAPCPVMIVTAPKLQHPSDLVHWYEDAITRYLRENTSTLTVFTPQEVARTFAPPNKKAPGRKEKAAAILALEQLARDGVLCRHDVKGELLYVND